MGVRQTSYYCFPMAIGIAAKDKLEMVTFHANCIAVEDMEDDIWLVGFADHEFDTQQYLLLQRSYADTEQDARLGMNTYHVERNDQVCSDYGGIARFELTADQVRIHFTETGARNLGVDEMEIMFQPDDCQFGELKCLLEQIFAGTDCLRIQPT